MQGYCHKCGRTPDTLQRCGRCKVVTYCSRECQKIHWKVHKKYCKENQAVGMSVGSQQMMVAAREGDENQVMGLLMQGEGIGVDENGNTLFHYLSANGMVRGLAMALEKDNQLLQHQNQDGNSALHWAAMTGQLESVKVLLSCGMNARVLNKRGNDAYDVASASGKENIMQYLMKCGEAEDIMEEGLGDEEMDGQFEEEVVASDILAKEYS